MRAILLAAGRGRRLEELTADRPKCRVEVAGRALLDWQLDALEAAGVDDIVLVRGYARAQLQDPRVRCIDNPAWASTNMVESLRCAQQELRGDLLIAYTDLLYGAGLVDRVRASSADVGVVIDRDWRALWERRMDDPLADAESLRLDPRGRILEIGQPVDDLEAIHGQYVGLVRLSPGGADLVRETLDTFGRTPGRPLHGVRALADAYLTDLLMRLIDDGHPVVAIPIHGGWCEVDSPRDRAVAEALWAEGSLPLSRKETACVP